MSGITAPRNWNRAIRYIVAPIAVAVALGCRMMLNHVLQIAEPFIVFYAAVLVSAWLGGFGPGLVATALSLLVVDYFYLQPLYTILGGGVKENVQIVLFTIIGVAIDAIVARMRREQRRFEQAADEARTSENEARRAETALRESQERLRATFDNAALGIIEVDTRNRLISANEHICQLLGYRREELLGITIHELTAPEDHAVSDELNLQLREGRVERLDYEKHYLRKDGSPLWVHVTVAAVRDSEGHILRFIGTVEDISKRKEAEEQILRMNRDLESSNAELRLQSMALNAAANGIVITDPSGTILWANPAYAAMIGYEVHEVIGKNPKISKSDKQDKVFYHELWEAIRRGAAWRGELINRRKDGTLYNEEMVITPVVDEHGTISHYIAIKQDITERKRLEKQLMDSERRLTDIIEFLPDPTFALDKEGRVIAWNKAMEDLTGTPALEVLGKGNHEYSSRLYGSRIHALADIALGGGEAEWSYSNLSQEEKLITAETFIPQLKPGGVWLSIKVAPIFDSLGNITGVIDSCRDITERKKAEEALQRANQQLQETDRRKDEFLAMLAHELRNPLAPIRFAAQMLNMNALPPEQLKKQREVIDRQISHMGRLLDDLLDVSRITRGKITLKREVLDLRVIARQALDGLLSMIEGRGQHLLFEAPSSPLLVNGDSTRLEQIIRNLLHNANKYTEAGGCIKLSLLLEPDSEHNWRAAVHVIDSGIGIDPEILPRVFEAFVQAEQGLARSQGGLGIGLAMVKSLVQMHGGSVNAFSKGLGCGSEFIVRLPLVSEAAERAAVTLVPEQIGIGRSKPRRVLVVDDNEDSVASLGELLSLWGHEVQTAHDGRHALAAARQWKPDIILLDIGLPGMDGYEVARRLREDSATTGVYLVALTGYGQEEDRRRAREVGFDRHITKPVELGQLQSVLQEAQAA